MALRTASLGLVAASFLGIGTMPAHAYLDPGTGSLLLQALLGGVAGVAVFGRSMIAGARSTIAARLRRRPDRNGDRS